MESRETMDEPLWRTTREKMFEGVKKALTNTRRNEHVISERGMPFRGTAYWYINDRGLVKINKWEGDHFDTDRWEIGNVFRSQQEAEQAREQLKEVLRRFHTNQESESRLSTP
jgi:hypothetical protein